MKYILQSEVFSSAKSACHVHHKDNKIKNMRKHKKSVQKKSGRSRLRIFYDYFYKVPAGRIRDSLNKCTGI